MGKHNGKHYMSIAVNFSEGRNDYSELAALCEAYKIKLLSGHNPNIELF
ncbi:hypothetical protein A3Q56_08214 [Intoshia linei]|uniref:Uncharacterized protein n=1 Tax=Intoshia linei TaxID=1819745 RepID=A0A177APY3_9BILA|nr:hypothetical protein A3Q56_08214 [Intoshia linei]